MNNIDDKLDQWETEIMIIQEALQKDRCLMNCIMSEIKNKKPIEQFNLNYQDFISSSNEVVESGTGGGGSLGLTTPPPQQEPSNVEPKGVCGLRVGHCSDNGADRPPIQNNKHFVTINFPRDQKLRLNKKVNYKYSDYKTKEQLMICNRIKHLFDSWEAKYNIYYEYCKDGNLHMHIILESKERARDIKIDINRFYNVNNQYFCDIRPVTDENKLKDYLINKKEKGYQTTGIPPIIKLI